MWHYRTYRSRINQSVLMKCNVKVKVLLSRKPVYITEILLCCEAVCSWHRTASGYFLNSYLYILCVVYQLQKCCDIRKSQYAFLLCLIDKVDTYCASNCNCYFSYWFLDFYDDDVCFHTCHCCTELNLFTVFVS